jgi:hypothetical protein
MAVWLIFVTKYDVKFRFGAHCSATLSPSEPCQKGGSVYDSLQVFGAGVGQIFPANFPHVSIYRNTARF